MGVDTRAILGFGVYGDEVSEETFDLEWAKAQAEGEESEDGYYEPDNHPEGGIHTVSNYVAEGQDNAFVGVHLAHSDEDCPAVLPLTDAAWCAAFTAKWGVAPRLALYVHWW